MKGFKFKLKPALLALAITIPLATTSVLYQKWVQEQADPANSEAAQANLDSYQQASTVPLALTKTNLQPEVAFSPVQQNIATTAATSDAKSRGQYQAALVQHASANVVHSVSTSSSLYPERQSTHRVDLNITEKLDGVNSLTLPLESDLDVTFKKKSASHSNTGSTVWQGLVEAEAGDSHLNNAILVQTEQGITGSVRHNGELYQIEPSQEGLHNIHKIDEALLPADHAADYYERQSPDNYRGLADTSPVADGVVTIKLLIAYTPDVVQRRRDLQGFFDLAIAETNTGLEQSGIDVKVELAHSYQVSYQTQGNMGDDHSRLTDKHDGYMDDVHDVRNEYGADIVVLITGKGNYCGLGWLNARESRAFATVLDSCTTGYYSFAHEIGHVVGAHHNPGAGTNYSFTYGHGYQDPREQFRTIMAYNCASGCYRANHWSTPDRNYRNQLAGSLQTNNNAEVWRQRAATVAAFRDDPAPVTPTVPPVHPTQPTTPTSTGQTGTVELSQLPLLESRIGWGQLQINQSIGKNVLTIGGTTFETGIGTHADSLLRYRLDGQYTRFQAVIGLDDEVGSRGSVQFKVSDQNGRTLFQSQVLTGQDRGVPVDVDVSGVQQLRLEVFGIDNIHFDHANWADAKLTGNGETSNTGGNSNHNNNRNTVAFSQTYQAEAAPRLYGARSENWHPGSEGGYVDYTATNGQMTLQSIQIPANAGSNFELSIRYALGAASGRPLMVLVNGQLQQTVSFAQTSNWRTWQTTQPVAISLRPGNNTIELVAAGQSGPNVDWVRIKENR